MTKAKNTTVSPRSSKKSEDGKLPATAVFELSVDQKTVASSYAKQLALAAQSVELKGFRKGKAPIALVEQSLDKSRLYSRILDEVIPPLYLAAIKKNSLVPLSEPRLTPVSMKEGEDWTFKVEIAVRPEFELGKYKDYVKKALADHAKAHQHDAKEEPEQAYHDHLQTIVFDALLANVSFAVSPLLVEDEAKAALARLLNQLKQLNLKFEDYLKSIKKSQEEFVKEYETTAADNLRLEFILQKLVEVEKPEVTTAEINELKPAKGQEDYARYLVSKRKVIDKLAKL